MSHNSKDKTVAPKTYLPKEVVLNPNISDRACRVLSYIYHITSGGRRDFCMPNASAAAQCLPYITKNNTRKVAFRRALGELLELNLIERISSNGRVITYRTLDILREVIEEEVGTHSTQVGTHSTHLDNSRNAQPGTHSTQVGTHSTQVGTPCTPYNRIVIEKKHNAATRASVAVESRNANSRAPAGEGPQAQKQQVSPCSGNPREINNLDFKASGSGVASSNKPNDTSTRTSTQTHVGSQPHANLGMSLLEETNSILPATRKKISEHREIAILENLASRYGKSVLIDVLTAASRDTFLAKHNFCLEMLSRPKVFEILSRTHQQAKNSQERSERHSEATKVFETLTYSLTPEQRDLYRQRYGKNPSSVLFCDVLEDTTLYANRLENVRASIPRSKTTEEQGGAGANLGRLRDLLRSLSGQSAV